MTIKIDDKEKIRRSKVEEPKRIKKAPEPPTAGTIDRIIDVAFNASKDKIREVTIIDRLQGRLLPQLDILALSWQYLLEVAAYRSDSKEYKQIYERDYPEPPNLIEEYEYRLAQWQKSIGGKNFDRAIDLALAETESRANMEADLGGKDFFDQ